MNCFQPTPESWLHEALLDGYQRTPRPSQEERAAISADLSLLDFDCAVPGFHPFFAGDVQFLD